MSDSRPLDVIFAKLDRPPQDPLHAAVVLEAWGGRTPTESFREAESLDVAAMPPGEPAARPIPEQASVDIREFGVLVAVLASVFLWLPTLRELLGDDLAPTMGWTLPAALALDRGLRVRYLASGEVRSILPALWGLTAACVVAIAVGYSIGTAAHIGVLLTIIWGIAAILAVRQWPLAYANIVIATATALHYGLDPQTVLTCCALVLLLTCAVAVLTTESERRIPESFAVTTAAAITGACAGILLTADADMWRGSGWWLGMAVLSVSLSGWWAAARLSMLWVELPTQLARVDLSDDRHCWGGMVVKDAVLGALIRIALPAYALLITSVFLGENSAAALVAAFAMFALAMLLLGLVVATQHWAGAALVSLLAAGTAVLVPPEVPGLPLLVGAFVAAVGFAIFAVMAFRDTPVAYATRMVIR